MRTIFIIGICLLFASLTVHSPLHAADAQQPPPSPETFLAQGKGAEYVRLAKEFLAKNPESEHAPLVALKLYQAVSLNYDPQEWRLAGLRLLGDYPSSLQAKYLIASMSAEECGEFLEAAFARTDPKSEPQELVRFQRAAELGFKRFGPQFGGGELILQVALASDDQEKRKAYLEQNAEWLKEQKSIVEVLASDLLSVREKFMLLRPLSKIEPAPSVQWFLFQTELTDEDRASPEIGVPIAEYLMNEDRPDLAARVLEKVCEKHATPQFLFAWAGADATAGNRIWTLHTLQRLVKANPPGPDRSPYAATAERLIPIFENLNQSQADQTRILGEAADAIVKAPPEVIELLVKVEDEEIGKFDAYLACHVGQEMIEAVVRAGEQVVFAFKTSPEDNRSFFLSEGRTRQYEKRAFPSPQFEIATRPSGHGKWNFGLSLHTTGRSRLQHFMESRLSSPAWTSSEARARLCKVLASGGIFPAPVKSSGDEQTCPWVIVDWKEPEFVTCELRVVGNSLVAVESEGLKMKIRYGKADQVALSPPTWPATPIAKVAECDGDAIWRLIGPALELAAEISRKEEAETAAREKKGTPRERF